MSLSINVQSGSDSVFNRKFPAADASKNSTGALVSSLKEAQTAVNQFLTELIVKSGSQGEDHDQDDEASDEEEEEADKTQNQSMKRKCDENSSSNWRGKRAV